MKTRHSPKLILKDRERQAEKEGGQKQVKYEKKREATEKTDVDLSRKNRERGDRET